MTQAPESGKLFKSLEGYYQFHAKIYDATRWSFLFGRKTIVQQIKPLNPSRILEVGCGTGKNLVSLCQAFPDATIVGLDLSEAMLARSRKNLGSAATRVELLHQAYEQPLQRAEGFDLILCAYSLSMINPGWQAVIEYVHSDLASHGHIAVVDFHDAATTAFKKWMGLNHVQMEGHLQPKLQALFQPKLDKIHFAYGGLWTYLTFIGQKEQGAYPIPTGSRVGPR